MIDKDKAGLERTSGETVSRRTPGQTENNGYPREAGITQMTGESTLQAGMEYLTVNLRTNRELEAIDE
jgi:hypothetical protein